jgi:hypothetical protein
MKINISITDKILIAIYLLSNKKKEPVKNEDVFVKAHDLYPEEFHISGYKQYPDSNKINKRLYTSLKPNGLIRIAGNKTLLTDLGLARAKEILHSLDKNEEPSNDDIYNYGKSEFIRILNSTGYQLYMNGRLNDIVDQDFYDIYRVSYKTPLRELKARIKEIDTIFEKIHDINLEIRDSILEYTDYLKERYSEIIKEDDHD